jgi:hypothetical protein
MEGTSIKQSVAVGTAFTVLDHTTAVSFGTTTPSVKVGFGRWLIFGRVTVQTAGATLVGSETLTVSIKDASSNVISTLVILLPAITTTTMDIGSFMLPIALQSNESASMTPDTLVFHAILSGDPSAGSVTITTGEITAIRLK